MNSKPFGILIATLVSLSVGLPPAHSQGLAFTYQGRLNDGGNPANGSYDLRFTLFADAASPLPIGGAITNSAVAVTNGLFTATLDFGLAAFPGANRWLDIGVRTNDGTVSGGGGFATLTPRQQLTPTPYAMTAENLAPGSGLSGLFTNAVNLSSAGNQFTGNGSGLTNVSATTLGGLTGFGFWQSTGNFGSSSTTNFLGTRDNQPLELRVNGVRAWRLEPTADTPNVIGNPVVNFVSPGMRGATIGGGGSIGAAHSNSVSAFYGTIGGGLANEIHSNAVASAIAGGFLNIIQNNSDEAAILGGENNLIAHDADHSTIAGGEQNEIQPFGDHSFIGGGKDNVIIGSSTLPVRATIGGGDGNAAGTNSSWSTISGGRLNLVEGYANSATIAGGEKNVIHTNASSAAISGGIMNTIGAGATSAAIGGGVSNVASGFAATVPGGLGNQASAFSSFAAGQDAHALHDHSFVWGDGSQTANSTGSGRFEVLSQGGINLYAGTNYVNIFAPGALAFGSNRRQMINLWNTNYGVGVQDLTFYERTDNGFAWFLKGSHTNAQNDPGPGGSLLMWLDQAGNLSITGSVTANGINWSGVGATNVNAATLGGLSVSNFWQLAGNAGINPTNNFVGTRDSQPLEIRANNVRGWRLEPTADAPNIIGNPVVNFAAPGLHSVTIGGGGAIAIYGPAYPNSVSAVSGTIGGGLGNTIQFNAFESTIAGGNQNMIQSNAFRGAICGGYANVIQHDSADSTISGGTFNIIQSTADRSVIGGGQGNVIVGSVTLPVLATIGGGDSNMTGTNSTWSTIGGGRLNLIEGYENSTTIPGGEKNVIHTNSSYATISGGIVNSIGPNAAEAAIGGGAGNNNQAIYGTIGGGQNNNIQAGASSATVSGGDLNVIGPGATDAVIAGGVGNTNQAGASFIGGGQFNLIVPNGFNSVIGGGYSNYVAGNTATVGGGTGNNNQAFDGTISGGQSNNIQPGASSATVSGGALNVIGPNATDAVIAGGVANNNQAGASSVGGGQFNLIIPAGFNSVIGGGYSNYVADSTSTIGGGAGNSALSYDNTIGGGRLNVVSGPDSTVGGGQVNTALGLASVIGGGQSNSILGTVLDSNHNPASAGSDSVISGGYSNLISGNFATIGGGMLNLAPGFAATVSGGLGNQAAGAFSFAAGQNAQALNDHSFVWGDGTQAAFSLGLNSFGVLATGGINFAPALGNVNILAPGSLAFGVSIRQMINLWNTNYGIGVQDFTYYERTGGGFAWYLNGSHTSAQNNPGPGGTKLMTLGNGSLVVFGSVTATNFFVSSDRNAKENFAAINAREVLAKVVALPLTEWNYKGDASARHLGPMAQDFQAAFQLSQDDKHISVVDEGGVALAAIQALNQKLEAEVKAKDDRLAVLEASVLDLQRLVARLNLNTPSLCPGGIESGPPRPSEQLH